MELKNFSHLIAFIFLLSACGPQNSPQGQPVINNTKELDAPKKTVDKESSKDKSDSDLSLSESTLPEPIPQEWDGISAYKVRTAPDSEPQVGCTSTLKSGYTKQNELAIFLGNYVNDAISDDTTFYNTFLTPVTSAALKKNLRICFYLGSSAALNYVASLKNVMYVLWVGHGTDGKLLAISANDPRTKQDLGLRLIDPTYLKTFKSILLKRVTLISCQAGKLKTEWNRVFNSPAIFDMAETNIPIILSARWLTEHYIPQLLGLEDIGLVPIPSS